ncbi:MAG: PEP-CTERM-box response regulator transcription factor, partial [Steroidobacteraceae bacterium]
AFDQYETVVANDRTSAIAQVRRFEPAVVTMDLGLPPSPDDPSEGLKLLEELHTLMPSAKVIVLTGQNDRDNALKAISMGAHDFCTKPFEPELLTWTIERAFRVHELQEENARLAAARESPSTSGIITRAPAMLRICRTIEKVAPTSATVLILGESGTGKELLARALHDMSPRRNERFVAINCAAIPDTLLESELFGYEKGAFTGAARRTAGKLESAEGGTVFLDEIGEMPASLQAKLLRVVQERTVERIGGRTPLSLDLRIVCATNRNLDTLIGNGGFREDLFYRISEVIVRVPPLRDRQGDSLLLAQFLLQQISARLGKPTRGLAPDAIRAIQAHRWPGNVRELENRVKGAVIMAEGTVVTASDLGLEDPGDDPEYLNLRVARQRAEAQAVRQSLAVAQGNLSRAADLLGVTRPTLYDLLDKHSIDPAQFGRQPSARAAAEAAAPGSESGTGTTTPV